MTSDTLPPPPCKRRSESTSLEGQAGLKMMAVLSLDQGQLTDVRAGAAIHHDRKLLRLGELVADALYLMDLGFYDHSLFAALDDADARFVSRLKEGVVPLIESVEAGVVDARHAVCIAPSYLDKKFRYAATRSWLSALLSTGLR